MDGWNFRGMEKKREAILPPSPLSIILKSILFKHVIEQHLLRISIFFELVSLSLSLWFSIEGYSKDIFHYEIIINVKY